jgi:hypothetical protein
MVILWPSFLVAIAAEGMFFSLFDPHELLAFEVEHDLSPMAIYSIGFFIFWTFCALASMLTYYLSHVPNDQPRF